MKILAQFEVMVNNNLYMFQCMPNSPTTEAKEALAQLMAIIIKIEEAGKAAQPVAATEANPEQPQE